mgnify:CR=1 FL=1
MRHSALRLLLTGCAALALAPAASAQDAPVIVDPPLSPPAIVILPAEAVDPSDALPPAVVPVDEEVEEAARAAPPIPAEWAPVPLDAAGRSAYGLYLSGRVAGVRGARADAAEFLASSHALAPEQPVVGEEAFRAAQPELMRAATKGVLHKNTASRKVSRLAQRVKALSA